MNYEFKENEKYKIHAYKHNGVIHRSWDSSYFLEKKDDYYVFLNNNVIVRESNGRSYRTNEIAVLFFSTKDWFNVIAQFKKNKIFFYCNIASPFVMEEKTLKYIDYDLDLRVFPDNIYKSLDVREYNYHKNKMNYPENLQKILEKEFARIKKLVRKKQFPFDKNYIYLKHQEYLNKKKQ